MPSLTAFVVAGVPGALYTVERAEVDDPAPALVAHVREDRLHGPERGPQPGVERRRQHLVGLLFQRDERREALGVVDEDVDAMVALDGLDHHAVDILLSSYVASDECGVHAQSGQVLGRPPSEGFAELGDHDRGSFPREPPGDALPGTRHDSHLALQPPARLIHRHSFP
jgi:hypothetical protein